MATETNVRDATEYAYDTVDLWRLARKHSLGGSEVAAVTDEHPYMTPLKVYNAKTGAYPEHDGEHDWRAQERMYWGLKLEKLIADEVRIRTDMIVHDIGHVIARNDRWEYVHASPDFRLEIKDAEEDPASRGILEVKTGGLHTRTAWDKGVPHHYWTQLQTYLTIYGYGWGLMACLLGGQELKIRHVPRDPDFEVTLDQACEWWEKHVIGGVAPGATANDYKGLTRVQGPVEKGSVVELPTFEGNELIADYRTIHAQVKRLQEQLDAIRARLAQLIGDAEVARLNGEQVATFRLIPEGIVSYSRKAKRQLRISTRST